MNGNPFINAVIDRLAKDGKCPKDVYAPILHLLTWTLLAWTRKETFDDDAVTRAVDDITRIGLRQEKEPRQRKRNGDEDKLSGAMMLEQVMPRVESIRQELFRSKDAPLIMFNAKKVLKWRNEQFEIERRYIETQDEKDKPAVNLGLLDSKAEEISKASGFDRWAVFFFILTGIRPKLFKWSASTSSNWYQLPNKPWRRNTEITITFRTRDLSFREFHKAYTSIKKEFLRTGRKCPKNEEKHLRVFKFVSSKGKSPGKGRAYWEPLRKEYEKLYPQDGFYDWQGFSRMYEGIIRRQSE